MPKYLVYQHLTVPIYRTVEVEAANEKEAELRSIAQLDAQYKDGTLSEVNDFDIEEFEGESKNDVWYLDHEAPLGQSSGMRRSRAVRGTPEQDAKYAEVVEWLTEDEPKEWKAKVGERVRLVLDGCKAPIYAGHDELASLTSLDPEGELPVGIEGEVIEIQGRVKAPDSQIMVYFKWYEGNKRRSAIGYFGYDDALEVIQ